MGDWFENRSAINIQTLEWSYKGLSKLNELGIPVYMIVGNHDLYRRTDRDTHSVRMFQELENITIVDKITELSINDADILIAPFLFHDEYATLSKYLKKDYWFGHFEFKGFVLTGATYKLEHGPDPDNFKGPKQIFSGHFHKRQSNKNITYTGNTFAMDFGDVDDIDRGMMILNLDTNKFHFINWDQQPRYMRANLSDITAGKIKLCDKLHIEIIVDVDLTYSEVQTIKEHLLSTYDIRSLAMTDRKKLVSMGVLEKLAEEKTEDDVDVNETTTDTVINCLKTIDVAGIDAKKLTKIYLSL